MEELTLGFIGGGRITRIFLDAIRPRKGRPRNIVVCDTDPAVREKLASRFGQVITICDDHVAAASQDIVFVSLHPPAIGDVLGKLQAHIRKDAILVSLAPKLTISRLSEILGGFSRIVRMLPNAPSAIGRGFNPVCFSGDLSAEEKQRLLVLFGNFGVSPEVGESKMEGYAIITGMGPTYLWFQLYTLYDLGLSFGLTEKDLAEALPAMVNGTVYTMFSEYSREEVIDLIPVKPIAENEEEWTKTYMEKLTALYKKIKP
jgi:pyrroline-5-carboxylate reductase